MIAPLLAYGLGLLVIVAVAAALATNLGALANHRMKRKAESKQAKQP
jgi:hypothetical protein